MWLLRLNPDVPTSSLDACDGECALECANATTNSSIPAGQCRLGGAQIFDASSLEDVAAGEDY